MRETVEKIQAFHHREFTALAAVADLARTIVPILRDSKMEHVAKELDRRLFELDAIKQEMADYMHLNVEAVIELLRAERPK